MSDKPRLFGTWRNTDVSSRSVTTLAFEADRGVVHAWAGPFELGAGAIRVFGGIEDPDEEVAFTAELSGKVSLQGNINRGLMILATYSWSSGRFTREFLARRDSGFVPPSMIAPHSEASPVSPSAVIDPSEFVGRWINTSERGDLRLLDIEPAGSGLALHVGGWPAGESHLFGYLDELGLETLLLLGRFDLPEGRSDLQIKVVTGTAVVAGFHARTDGRSWFTREFLHRPGVRRP